MHVSVNQYVLTCHTQCITIKCVEHIYNQSIKKLVHITSFRSLNNKHVWLATQNTLLYNSLIHNMFTMCSFMHVLISAATRLFFGIFDVALSAAQCDFILILFFSFDIAVIF